MSDTESKGKIFGDTPLSFNYPNMQSNKYAPKIVMRDVEGPDGRRRLQFLWEREKDFVTVVLIVRKDKVDHLRFKKEFKFGIMSEALTSAAGGINDDEDPLAAASRTLLREFGVDCWSFPTLLGPFVESPDKILNGRQWVTFTRIDTRREPEECEPGEQIDFPLTKEGIAAWSVHPANKVVLQRLAVYETLRHIGKLDLLS